MRGEQLRTLLLLSGLAMTALAAGLLLVALVTREVRVRRRAAVQQALRVVTLAEQPLGPVPVRVGRAVLLELADRLSAEALVQTAPALLATTTQASDDLLSRRWLRRTRGLRTLQPLALSLEELLAGFADRHPRVRAQAASAAAGSPEPEVLDGLVALLDDPAPFVRFCALDAVARRGAHAGPALARALETTPVLTAAAGRVAVPSLPGPGDPATAARPLRPVAVDPPEVRRLLLLLHGAAAAADGLLVGPVLRFAADARPDVRCAAVRALAVLGADPELVRGALDDPDGRVREAAVLAVGRVGNRSLAGVLAPRLRDRDHGVREAAARALAGLGAAGGLLLRAALSGPDRYAADAARAALGLPPLSDEPGHATCPQTPSSKAVA